LREGQHIAAKFFFGEDNAQGRVINISCRGAKLAIDEPPPSDAEVTVQLSCERVKWTIELPAQVHWRQPDRHEGWYVGCSFEKAVQAVALERLAAAGVIDRRQEVRQAINTDVQVKLELSDAPLAARLVDFSVGGFKLWLPCSVSEGERIVVNIEEGEDELRSVGKVLWYNSTGDGFFVGCTFVRRDGFAHMTKQLKLDPLFEAPRPRRRLSLAHGMSLAAAVSAAAYGLYTHFWM